MASSDDTPTPGEFDDVPTALDPTVIAESVPSAIHDVVTASNDLGPVLDQARDVGFNRGWVGGQDDALVALRSLLLERGSPNDEAAHVVAAVRARLTRL
jgi:hypothetical protein